MRPLTCLILTVLSLTAASTVLADDPETPEEPREQPQRPGITRVEPGTKIQDIKSDPFTLGEVTIEGDILKIKVSYPGGAAEHDFAIYWNGIELKSYPAQIHVALKHDAHGDTAEALIEQALEFDLTSIRKPTIIHLHTDHGGTATVQYGER